MGVMKGTLIEYEGTKMKAFEWAEKCEPPMGWNTFKWRVDTWGIEKTLHRPIRGYEKMVEHKKDITSVIDDKKLRDILLYGTSNDLMNYTPERETIVLTENTCEKCGGEKFYKSGGYLYCSSCTKIKIIKKRKKI